MKMWHDSTAGTPSQRPANRQIDGQEGAGNCRNSGRNPLALSPVFVVAGCVTRGAYACPLHKPACFHGGPDEVREQRVRFKRL